MQPELTIFYDGHCPMCSLEMDKLKRHDQQDKILLVDLHSDNLQSDYPDIDFEEGMAVLHGKYRGKTLLGLEVTHRAWTLVGKGFWVAPLNWPVLKQISHQVYLVVAKYRHPISQFMFKRLGIGNPACQSDACELKSPKD